MTGFEKPIGYKNLNDSSFKKPLEINKNNSWFNYLKSFFFY